VVAIELLVAAEAVEVAEATDLAPATRALYDRIRALVPPLTADRPLGADVERLAGSIALLAAAAR
jgi:histidine ammonia-lyase